MGNPTEVRADIERTHSTARADREKQYIAERADLEADFRSDLNDIEQTRVDDLANAGLNPDGSVPPTYDREDPVNITAPHVTGTPTTGQTLTCTDGVWSRADGKTFQWLRDGVDIGGATADTHVLVQADETHNISCRVTAANESGSTSAVSNAVAATA